MLSLLTLLPGIALPAIGGWLGLRLLERNHPVLLRCERWALAALLGLTYGMFAMFLAHLIGGVPLTRIGFLTVFLLLTVLLAILFRQQKLPLRAAKPDLPASPRLTRGMWILWTVLLGWIAVRTFFLALDFLVLTPVFLDDALDNWNLRGKVFSITRSLTLTLPGEDPLSSVRGISSYPPSLPLVKTWLAALWGDWSEPLINSIQLLWYIAALVLVFSALRRRLAFPWALLGAYLLGSLPLFLMHGTNPYADAFMAAHLFAAVSLLFAAFQTQHTSERWSFLKLLSVALPILPFVKNEGLLLYLPPLLLITAWQLLRAHVRGAMDAAAATRTVVLFALTHLVITGSWLLYKWSIGMTFGNAKPFTSLGIGWQKNVLHAIVVNTFFEGNWLLLFPLFFALLLWQWRAAFTRYGILTAFFLIVYIGQASLYLFTGLATEALRQTGYARGLIHLVPVVVTLTVLLLHEAALPFLAALRRSDRP